MREIVNIQLGQCGNQIGEKFWETICLDHQIPLDGKILFENVSASQESSQKMPRGKYEVYFKEINTNPQEIQFVPRSILVDMEPGVLDSIRGGKLRDLFKPDNMVNGTDGSCNNWAKGYLQQGAEYIEQVMDIIRRECEFCDCIQAFQLSHSVGGGTGSGFGSLLLCRLYDEFPDILLMNASVLPSTQVSDVVVEPYNTILSLAYLVDYSNGVFCIDNEALYKICMNKLKVARINYNTINQLIASTLGGVTTSLRFPGQLNSDVRKLSVNMVPFPRLHFYMTGLSPLVHNHVKPYLKNDIAEVTRDLFEPSNMLCDCDPKAGRYLTFAAIYRGETNMKELEEAIMNFQNKNSSSFVEWIPHNAKVASCDVPLQGHRLRATFIANNTAIQDVLRRAKDRYAKMMRRKAFLHWYTGQGMEELQFMEAEANIVDIISEYEQYTYAPPDSHLPFDFCELEDSLEEIDSGFGELLSCRPLDAIASYHTPTSTTSVTNTK